MPMGSKFIEGPISEHKAILDQGRDLINEKGETAQYTQVIINPALDELGKGYEMRKMGS